VTINRFCTSEVQLFFLTNRSPVIAAHLLTAWLDSFTMSHDCCRFYKFCVIAKQLTVFFCKIVHSMFPRSTHETFAQKLYTTFKNNKRFAKPKLSRTDFTIVHYAGDVSLLRKCILFKRKLKIIMSNELFFV
jgi:hypothetical protein